MEFQKWRFGFRWSPHGAMRRYRGSAALSLGRTIMPTYRAYLIDRDNRVRSFKTIEADSDENALAAAKLLVDGHDIEVWLLDRLVGRLNR
jgi:hypothetical protein